MWSILLSLGLSVAAARPLHWDLTVPEGDTVRVDLVDPTGTPVTHWLIRDGGGARQLGWRPDLAEEPGVLRATLPALWLPPGDYALRSRWSTGDRTETLTVDDAAPRLFSVRLPEGATGVQAVRWSPETGTDGFAWAPDLGGVTFLPVGAGEWVITAPGRPDLRRRISAATPSGTLSLGPAPRERARSIDDGGAWLVSRLLAPATGLVLLGLVAMALRLRRSPGLRWGLLAALVFAAVPVWPFLLSPASLAPMPDAGFRDGVTSATLAGAIAEAAPHLRDVSTAWGWPEGHSWLALGPSWLAYLLVAPVAALAGGLVAHNLGLYLLGVLLGLGAWALARSRGLGTAASTVATALACLAPAIADELDKASLDRAGLFLVPVFLLCLDRAAQRGGAWVLGAAVALAGTFLLQTYYGLYLAAACPLLVLPRLLGPRPGRRLLRLAAVGGLGLALLVPGLWVLRAGTTDTVYADDGAVLADEVDDLWHPLGAPADAGAAEDLRRFLEQNDPKLSRAPESSITHAMATPRDRLQTAVAHAKLVDEVLFPSSTLPLRASYWFVALAALLLARRRRGAALGAWDVGVVLLMALGPVARVEPLRVGPVLPYYAYQLWVPGFDQLKHPGRFAMLAAAVSGIPAAALLDGLLRRARWLRPAAPLLVAATAVLAVAVHVRGLEEAQAQGVPHLDVRGIVEDPRLQAITLDHATPRATAFPPIPALAALAGQPSLVLPVVEPLPVPVFMAICQARIPVVNGAPHGLPERSPLPPWVESNATLNDLAWRSGSDRARLWTGGAAASPAGLAQSGLQNVILFRTQLPHPSLVAPTEALLDTLGTRTVDTEAVAVWRLHGAAP